MLTPKRHVFVCINERQGALCAYTAGLAAEESAPPPRPADALPCCAHRGGREVYEALRAAVARAGLNREVWVTRTGCMVHCTTGPTVVVYPEDVWYGGVTVADVAELVREHLAGGRPVERLRLGSRHPT